MPSLSDELGITSSLSQELGIGSKQSVLPPSLRKSMEFGNKKPVEKILEVVGDVIVRPKNILEKKLRGKGVAGNPANPEEELAKLRYDNPYLYPLARVAAQSPGFSKALQREGRSAKNIVNEIDEGWLPSAAGGFLQSTANAPISIANAALGETDLGEIPYLDLEQYKPADTLASDIGFTGGQVGGYVAPFAGLNKVLGYRPEGAAGLLADITRGGGVGYLLGGENGDIGRYLGAAGGALFEPLSSLGSSKIAGRVVDKANQTQQFFKKQYSNIFKTAAKNNIHELDRIPNIEHEGLELFRKSKFGKSLDRFLQKPTIKNAHDFQSDLGKYANTLDKATVTRALSAEEINILPKLIEAQKRVRGSLFQTLEKSKGLGSKYQKVSNDYSKYGTIFKNKAIKEFMRGDRNAADLVKSLSNTVKSRAHIVPKMPEIAISQQLKKYAPWLSGIGATAGVSGYIGKHIYDLLHGNE